MLKKIFLSIIILHFYQTVFLQPRSEIDFNKGWKFLLKDDSLASNPVYNDVGWRNLTLPHDWSIEFDFAKENPATTQDGALPTGIGWYRKTFILPASAQNKNVRIEFDGMYRNSEVWINGNYLGKRPYGYSSFSYDLSKYIKPSPAKNVIAVKVDNSQQPNSRWYSGSGIYRNVRLVVTNKISIEKWGTFTTTAIVNAREATINIKSSIINKSERDEII